MSSNTKRTVTENGDTGEDSVLATMVSNGEDLEPMVTLAFETGKPEARQLITLLLSSQPENFMNPLIREKNYNTLDYKSVATICERYKDSADGIFGSLSNRSTKQSARKKSMDTLKKRLRNFN